MRISAFTAVVILLASASAVSAIELKGESFVILRDLTGVNPGYQLRPSNARTIIYETESGDIPVYFKKYEASNTRPGYVSKLYLKILNKHGSKKLETILIKRKSPKDTELIPSGLIDLPDGSILVSYYDRAAGVFTQKVQNGSLSGPWKKITSVKPRPIQDNIQVQRNIRGYLLKIQYKNMFIWHKYYGSATSKHAMGINIVDAAGDVQKPEIFRSKDGNHPIGVMPQGDDLQIVTKRWAPKSRTTNYSAQTFDENIKPVDARSRFFTLCRWCEDPNVSTLEGGNQLILTNEFEDPSPDTFTFVEIRNQLGDIVTPRTKLYSGAGYTLATTPLPGGDFISIRIHDDWSTSTRSHELIRFNQSLQQVGGSVTLPTNDIYQILALRNGSALVAYPSRPDPNTKKSKLIGQFIRP